MRAATKKFTSKAKSVGKKVAKNVTKSAKRNLPTRPKQAVSVGDSWYGPDRALYLGEAPLL